MNKKNKILFLLSFSIFISSTFVSSANSQKTEPKPNSKTVLLTGAAGFIGSNFLKYMFDKYPNYNFIILDALTYAGNLDNVPVYIKQSPRFKFVYGTVTNYFLVDSLMQEANFVVHFAAESHVTRSIYDDSTFIETDVMGTRVMMATLIKHPNIERFIHISTSEVYGTALSEYMDEEHPLNPRSPYAGAKAGADRLVYSYFCTYDVPVVIIRPFNNYGPQQHLEKMVPRFITRAIKGEPLTIHGNGQQKRDWVHVNDTCRALDKVLHIADFSKIKNQVINVGTGIATSVLDIAKIVLNETSRTEKLLSFIGDRPGQVECHISSTKKAKELLGWEAEIKLEDGIKQTVDWYLSHQDYWRKNEMMIQLPIYTLNKIVEMH